MLIEKFETLLTFLSSVPEHHSRQTDLYKFMDDLLKNAFSEAKPTFEEGHPIVIGELGPISLPYVSMGAVDSLDLFGLDELLLFSFYWRNRHTYSRVADIGANIGLHSIVLDRCGYKVTSFEPDPNHIDLLQSNLSRNNCENVDVYQKAVSDRNGQMEFLRLLGNTTGSHLAGSKENPYGEIERFEVEVTPIQDIMTSNDLVKIDAEGHEKQILLGTKVGDWTSTDAMVEVGSDNNAIDVFEHLDGMGVNLFAQKWGWRKVKESTDMPTSYKEGSLFVSKKTEVPW